MADRIFLDANALFTAAISPDGASRAIFDHARGHDYRVVSSAFPVDEARRNLRAKFPDKQADLEKLLGSAALVPEAPGALVAWAAERLPAKDAPILAAANAGKATVLVTGDRRHFGDLYRKRTRGVLVLPPREALELLLGLQAYERQRGGAPT